MSRGDMQQRQQYYLCYYSSFVRFLRQLIIFFNDNKDNRNNGKNGRNCGCHEVTYNRDNKITVANSLFSSNLSTEQNPLTKLEDINLKT